MQLQFPLAIEGRTQSPGPDQTSLPPLAVHSDVHVLMLPLPLPLHCTRTDWTGDRPCLRHTYMYGVVDSLDIAPRLYVPSSHAVYVYLYAGTRSYMYRQVVRWESMACFDEIRPYGDAVLSTLFSMDQAFPNWRPQRCAVPLWSPYLKRVLLRAVPTDRSGIVPALDDYRGPTPVTSLSVP